MCCLVKCLKIRCQVRIPPVTTGEMTRLSHWHFCVHVHTCICVRGTCMFCVHVRCTMYVIIMKEKNSFFTTYAQQKAKQEAAASSADHKDSDVKEGVAEEEGEWVEYVDLFGRTRRCPKEDLPHVQAEEQRRRERSKFESTPK